MKANLVDSSNPQAITKKFWSFIKSNSNTSRIPNEVHYNGIYVSSDQRQADLFNNYFLSSFLILARTILISTSTDAISKISILMLTEL